MTQPLHWLLEAEDIAANRGGMLVPIQRERLLSVARSQSLFYGRLGGILGAIATWALTATLLGQPADGAAPGAGRLYAFGGSFLFGAVFFGAIVTFLVRRWWYDRITAERPVATETGTVEFDGKVYRARTDSCRLHSPFGDLELTPGRYRFNYVRGTRWLVSVELLDRAAEHLENFRTVLAAAAAPRSDSAGQSLLPVVAPPIASSPAGEAPLRLRRQLRNAILSVGLFVSLWFVFALDLFPGIRKQLGDDPLDLTMLTLVTIGVVAWLSWRARGLWQDLRDPALRETEGIVTKSADMNDSESTSYFVEVNGLRFSVNRPLHDALFSGLRYRVYYTPRSKILIRIEPVLLCAPEA